MIKVNSYFVYEEPRFPNQRNHSCSESKQIKETLLFHPKQGDNATKTQQATGNEKEQEDFRRNRKPNPKQETKNK